MGIETLHERHGACHCGAVRFTVRLPAELRGARCDCSICAIKGAVTVGTPLDGLTILEGEDLLTLYQFNTGTAKHYFCSRCGAYTFHQRRSDPNTYGINVACLGLNPTTTSPTSRWSTACTTRATPARCAWPAGSGSSPTKARASPSGVSAGPLSTAPSGANCEPWHGQSQHCSNGFQCTTQPRCVHAAERRISRPSGVR